MTIDIKKTIRAILPIATHINPVGSRETCSPPPLDTDNDYLVFISGDIDMEIDRKLKKKGFTLGGSVLVNKSMRNDTNNSYHFFSYTKGDLNLILIDNYEFYKRFMIATSLCKSLNVMKKEKRIELFQYILYGNHDVLW